MFTRFVIAALLASTPAVAKTWVPENWPGDCLMGDAFVTQPDAVSYGPDLFCTIEERRALYSLEGNLVLRGAVICSTDWPDQRPMTFSMTFERGESERMVFQWNTNTPEPYRLCAE